MKKIKLGLLPKIIIAIILGIGFGIVSPDMPVRVFVTFNALFSEFLGFLIPLIIVGLVTPAIADIGKGAGKLLVITALMAYGATVFSGFLSYGVGQAVCITVFMIWDLKWERILLLLDLIMRRLQIGTFPR